jgi:integrase
MNADRLTGDALQAMMRHKSYTTTQRYIAAARQLDQSAEAPYIPDLELKKAAV